MEDDDSSRGAKPNSQFLARVLQGLGRSNQRVVETHSSRAAQKAVGSNGAASLRPALQRAGKQGAGAVRRAALTSAMQQKLVLCSALLSEVALTFGFKLRITNPYGLEISNEALNQAAAGGACLPSRGEADAAQQGGAAAAADDGGASGHVEAGSSGANDWLGLRPGGSYVQLQPLDVSIHCGEEDEDEEGEEGGGVVSPRVLSPGTRRKLVSRPQLQLGSRLTTSALGAVGLVGLARRRAMSLRRQSSGVPNAATLSKPAAQEILLESEPAGNGGEEGAEKPAEAGAEDSAAASAQHQQAVALNLTPSSALVPTDGREPGSGVGCSGKGGKKIIWPSAGEPAKLGQTGAGAAAPWGAGGSPAAAGSKVATPEKAALVSVPAVGRSGKELGAPGASAVPPSAGVVKDLRQKLGQGRVSEEVLGVDEEGEGVEGVAAVQAQEASASPAACTEQAPEGSDDRAAANQGVGPGREEEKGVAAPGSDVGAGEGARPSGSSGPQRVGGEKRLGGRTLLFGAAMRDIKKVKGGS